MKKTFNNSILFFCLFSLMSFTAFADESKNDCSIGVCHYDLISNNNLDKFADILAALNKSADGDQTVEVKSLGQCKKLTEKQFEHMFFNGDPKNAKDEIYNDGSYTLTTSTLKYAVINKDYIIREVRVSINYAQKLIGKTSSPKSTLYTLVQDKNTCELKQMIKGNPFTINN